jgi:hypothetical protein
MTRISDLVTEIKKQTLAKNPRYLCIHDVEGLIRLLEELDSVPGQMKVKETLVEHVIYFINNHSDDSHSTGTGASISSLLKRIWN